MTADVSHGGNSRLDEELDGSFPASDPPSRTSPVVGVGAPGRVAALHDDGIPAFGFALSSEENPPSALVHQAVLAEAAGLDFLSISDHFHPWLSSQGQSPFVWSVIGGIAAVTSRISLGTGVTCPILRIHPAIVAQAAATAAAMMEGRFYLGLGTGEALNELVTGARWPSGAERVDRLQEAITIIRQLLAGEPLNFDGRYYTVSEARLFTRPGVPPPILIAASSPASARIAAANDGLVSSSPDPDVFQAFEEAGGGAKPRIGQITICWDEDESTARAVARQQWPTTMLGWSSRSVIPTPEIFEDATRFVDEDAVASHILCGPRLEAILEKTAEYLDAGFTHVYYHQVGHRQDAFLEVCRDRLVPELRRLAARVAS